MFPQDSITHTGTPTGVVGSNRATDSTQVRSAKPRTPYQVLRSLPRDATPAQQDSAIQATFQPAKIHYSNQPDTLHLPGLDKGVKLTEVNIPIYYEKTFFEKSIKEAAKTTTMYGVPGDPVPYTLHSDNIITSVLLGSLILSLVLIANLRTFALHQLKTFFYVPRIDDTFMPETSSELRCQVVLLLQTCLLFSILLFFFTRQFIGETFVLQSDYMLAGIYFAMLVGYYLLRALLYTFVNLIFFDYRRNTYWLKTLLFISSIEGLVIFPLIMLMVYFDLSTQSVILYFAISLILVKFLTIYKCFVIFFRRMSGFLQIILYFCALEIVPLAAFMSAVVLTGYYLKISY